MKKKIIFLFLYAFTFILKIYISMDNKGFWRFFDIICAFIALIFFFGILLSDVKNNDSNNSSI